MMGVQTREAFCKDSAGSLLNPLSCAHLNKEITEKKGCNAQECVGYNWMTTTWSTCSPTSGTAGKRTRSTHCHAPGGGNAFDAECEARLTADSKPVLEEACVVGVCMPDPGFPWIPGPEPRPTTEVPDSTTEAGNGNVVASSARGGVRASFNVVAAALCCLFFAVY